MKYLLGIANGKWVLEWAWLGACLKVGHAAPEDAFEVGEDSHGPTSGPILARLSVMEANPRILSGWQVRHWHPAIAPGSKRMRHQGKQPRPFFFPLSHLLSASWKCIFTLWSSRRVCIAEPCHLLTILNDDPQSLWKAHC